MIMGPHLFDVYFVCRNAPQSYVIYCIIILHHYNDSFVTGMILQIKGLLQFLYEKRFFNLKVNRIRICKNEVFTLLEA